MSPEQQSSPGYSASKAYSYYVFTLLFLLYTLDYADRYVVVSLFPFLKTDWGLTDTQCGMLVSAVYWSILVFTFPVSILIDRWSRRKGIGIMSLLWSLATLSAAFTRNFGQLFAAKTAIGIGEAGYSPGGTAMISALFPQEKRAAIMGFWNASIPLGSALGIVIGGVIAETFGWRYAFGLVALPGFIIALLFFRVRDYKTVELVTTVENDEGEPGVQVKMKAKDIALRFIKTPSLLLTFLGFAGNTFVTCSLMSWLPTFFHRVDGIDMSKAGLKGGAVMAMAIIGAPLGGYLADRWQKSRPNARLLLSSVTSLCAGITLFLAFTQFEGAAQYAVLLLGGCFAVAFVPAAAAVTQDVVHPGLRAMSYSLCVIIQHLLGSSLGPIFTGAASDAWGLPTALSILPLFALVSSVLFFVGSYFYVSDLNKVEKVSLVAE